MNSLGFHDLKSDGRTTCRVLYRYGFLGKKFKDSFGHICGPILSGLVGLKKPRDHGIPYSLTEEFASVYRMHCLLPDKLVIRDLNSTNADYSDPPVIEEYFFFSLHSPMPLEMLINFIKANLEGDIVSIMKINFFQIIGKTIIMNIQIVIQQIIQNSTIVLRIKIVKQNQA